jgi:hypothetical protein
MATVLPEGQNLNSIKAEGTYLVIDPVGLDAGSYVVIVSEGADAEGNNYLFQRAMDVRTGIEFTRAEEAAGFADWVSGTAGDGADIVAAIDDELGSDDWQSGGGGGGNTELSATLQLYVNGGTGSDSNDGLTALTAKETIQAAFDLAATYDVNPLGAIHGSGGQFIQINVEAGTYDEQVTVPRFKNRMSIDLEGSGAGDVIINPTAQTYAMLVEHSNCQLTISGDFDFRNASAYGLAVIGPSSRVTVAGVKYTSVAAANVYVEGGHYLESNATITGDNAAHIFALKGAFLELSGSLTLVGTPNWASAFINAGTGCTIYATYSPITGASVGVQFILSSSILHIFGGEAYANGLVAGLPGDAIGTWGTAEVKEPYSVEARTFTTGASPITLSPGAQEIRYRLVSGGTAAAEVFALGSGQWMGQRVTVEFLTRTNAADRPQLDDTNIKFSSANPAAGTALDFGANFNDYQLVDAGDSVAFEWGGDGWYMVFADPLPVLT